MTYGIPAGQSMPGYQPYQGPVPFQLQPSTSTNLTATDVTGINGNPFLTAGQGIDTFTSSLGGLTPPTTTGSVSQLGQFGIGNTSNLGGFTFPTSPDSFSGINQMTLSSVSSQLGQFGVSGTSSLYPASLPSFSSINQMAMMGTPSISDSTLQVMSMISTQMGSVTMGLGEFVQSLLLSVQKRKLEEAAKKEGEESEKDDTNEMDKPKTASDQFILPLDKQYIKKPGDGGDFGPREAPTAGASTNHKGDDFGTGGSTPPIYAVQSGTITVKPNNGGAGNTVEIDHGNGLVTKYFHMSKIGKFDKDGKMIGEYKTGDKVEQGDIIGMVGTTGTSTGNHLHFEVHKNGEAVDPWPYLSGLL